MISLQQILDMWNIDCEIDDMKLDEASRDAAKLHAKYLQLYGLSKLQYKREQQGQKILLKNKFLYYNGKMTRDEIDEHGWDYNPFGGLKILKSDLDKWYECDSDIQKSEEKLEYWKVVVDTLKDILDNVKWRHQTIKNMIEFKKFQAGV